VASLVERIIGSYWTARKTRDWKKALSSSAPGKVQESFLVATETEGRERERERGRRRRRRRGIPEQEI
jgi:hypothetical protein